MSSIGSYFETTGANTANCDVQGHYQEACYALRLPPVLLQNVSGLGAAAAAALATWAFSAVRWFCVISSHLPQRGS